MQLFSMMKAFLWCLVYMPPVLSDFLLKYLLFHYLIRQHNIIELKKNDSIDHWKLAGHKWLKSLKSYFKYVVYITTRRCKQDKVIKSMSDYHFAMKTLSLSFNYYKLTVNTMTFINLENIGSTVSSVQYVHVCVAGSNIPQHYIMLPVYNHTICVLFTYVLFSLLWRWSSYFIYVQNVSLTLTIVLTGDNSASTM